MEATILVTKGTPEVPQGMHLYLVASKNLGTPILTPKFYDPYSGDPLKGTPKFGKPPF